MVSNYAAFEERYNPAGTANILVLGVYSGHLSNGGDTVDIYQVGNRESGSVAAANGYVLSYRVDHINYNNAAPWPIQAGRRRPGLDPHQHGRLRQRRRSTGRRATWAARPASPTSCWTLAAHRSRRAWRARPS